MILAAWVGLGVVVVVGFSVLGRAGRRADAVSEETAAQLIARREAHANVTPIGSAPTAQGQAPAAASPAAEGTTSTAASAG